MRGVFLPVLGTLVLLFPPLVWAQSGGKGVAMEIALGRPAASVQNPDATKANYEGFGFGGRARFPLLEDRDFGADVFGSLFYRDLENTANSGAQAESARLLGVGAGMELRFLRFIAGVDYSLVKGRHIGQGGPGGKIEYDMNALTYYLGLGFRFGPLLVTLTYNQSQADIPAAATGFGEASPYSETGIWLGLKYSLGISPEKLAKGIVSN